MKHNHYYTEVTPKMLAREGVASLTITGRVAPIRSLYG